MNSLEKQYFIPGETRDNFVFLNCKEDFFNKARKCLSKNNGKIPSVCIDFSKSDTEKLQPFMNAFEEQSKRMILARTFVNTKVFNSFFRSFREKNFNFSEEVSDEALTLEQNVLNGEKVFENGNVKKFIDYYIDINFFLNSDNLKRLAGGGHKFELNIFEKDVEDVFIQRAINNFLSCRSPFSIKVFSNQNDFCIYVDENNNLIEQVHDYMDTEPFDLSPSMER